MNGDLFTLSGSLPILTKFSCFLALSLQTKISLRFFPHKNPLTFRSTNIVKEKKISVLPHFSALLNQQN